MSNGEEEACYELFELDKWIPQFLIDDSKRKRLCFRETLIICSKTDMLTKTEAKPIGGYCILVESIGPRNRQFLVHVQSSMSIDGHFGGSKVIGTISERLQCLEEKRTEFVYKDDGLYEDSIFIGAEDDCYHINMTHVCPCDKSTRSMDVPFCCNNRFIGEGVHVVLMRYLALMNYQGTLTFQGISIDGESTMSNYNCIPAEHMELDGHYISVYTIERSIRKKDGSVHNIKSYLSPYGKILRHNWLDIPYLLKINPLEDPLIINRGAIVETPLKDRWTEDIEMLSKYFDTKSSRMAQNLDYMADHPEIRHLIADYVQSLLVVKPVNTIDFAIQHFKAFARDPITWEANTAEQISDFDLKIQIAKEKSESKCNVCGFRFDGNESEEETSTKSSELSDDKTSSKRSSYSNCLNQGIRDEISSVDKYINNKIMEQESKITAQLCKTCDD